ncbi:hypothetical protein ElyMa_003264600 [Elysia marginata]|uniref:Vinculin n=1 Tax=Elysia marginata TaxID=1093978 RepID=A0AAV4J9A4_9GAST|nr:hypothetical protein ElyMa_003264600 [Elysia marginata]
MPGSAAEIHKLVRRLVTSSARHETRAVEKMTHGILSWTNHIVENAGMLLAHCPHIAKEGELKGLIKEVDRVAPSVIQQARFACAGENQTVYTLTTDASYWASKLNSARVIVDVAADRWLVLTSDLRELTQGRDQHKLKLAVAAIISAQKEMSALLLKTRFLAGNFLQDGPQKIQFLTDSHAEIENLAVTIQTALDVASVSDTQDDQTWWQLGIACRDWAVMMSCVAAELDNIADVMGSLASLRMPSLAPLVGDAGSSTTGDGIDGTDRLEMKGMRLADVVEKETDSLLELVDCVVAGSALKARSDSLVLELQAALTDIFSVARQPVMMNKTAHHSLLCRLRIGLAKSRWIERALEIQDLIRNSCFQFMGFARTLLLDAQDISIKEESEGSIKVSEARHRKSVEFLQKSSALKQRTLRAIQLCPELNRRAVVRSTLDSLAKLTTEIGNVMRAPEHIPDAKVSALTQQWGARIKKLLTSLGKMDKVKPRVISEIEKFNRGSTSEFSRPGADQLSQTGPISVQETAHQGSFLQRQQQLPPTNQYPEFHTEQNDVFQLQQSQYSHQMRQQPPSEPEHQQHKNLQPHHKPWLQKKQQPSLQPQLPYQQQHRPYQQDHQHSQEEQQLQSHQPHQQGYQPPGLQQAQHMNAQHRLQPRHHDLWQQYNKPQQQHAQLVGYHQSLPKQEENPAKSSGNHSLRNAQICATEGEQFLDRTNPVQITLNTAQDLGLHLKRWGGHNVRHLMPVQASLDVAQLCTEMAMYARGQGIFKSSAEVVEAAEKITNLCRQIEIFGQRMLALTGQGRTRDHIQVCLNKIHGCTSQLHIIATAANNSARSHESDRILVRNAFNVLSSLQQFFTAVEGLAAKGVHAALPNADTSDGTDPLTQQAVELLVTLKAETDRYLAEDRQSGSTDLLGLHRMELHRPPSLASLLDIDLEDDKDERQTDASLNLSGKGDSCASKVTVSPRPAHTKYREPVSSVSPDKRDGPLTARKNFVSSGTTNENLQATAEKHSPGVAFQCNDKNAFEDHNSQAKDFSENSPLGNSVIRGAQVQASASTSTDGVDEELIEKVMSPNSEPDIERLFFKLDEAIEGRWVEPGVNSPPPDHLAWPSSQSIIKSIPRAASKQEVPVAISKWSEGENKFQAAERDVHAEEDVAVPDGNSKNESSLLDDKTRPQSDLGSSSQAYSHNLDSPENQEKSSKNRYYKSKYKAPVRLYKPLRQKNQSQNKYSGEGNSHSNQSENDWDSIVGGASVDSFLLQSEDVFEEPTKGAVQYHSDTETAAISLSQDPLSSGRNYDSGSEVGLVSAASFLLSHEDVFSENQDTWDTHF